MKLIASLIALTFSLNASADIIKCSFTEPFLTTEYSMAQQTLRVSDDVMKKAKVFKNVSFQIVEAGKFQLQDKKGNVLQTLSLTNNGSDGMSDTVYPYEVTSSDKIQYLGANNGVGGCSSNFLKIKTEPIK